MGHAYTVEHHHLSPGDWAHAHQRLVRASLSVMIAALAVAITALSAPMVQDALTERSLHAPKLADAASTASLPREWAWSLEPITFDHMYRHNAPVVRMDYIRDHAATGPIDRRSSE
jgi:hypothetical protein